MCVFWILWHQFWILTRGSVTINTPRDSPGIHQGTALQSGESVTSWALRCRQPCRAANGSQYTQAEDNMSQTLTFKMLHALFATRNTCRSRAAWVYSVDSAWMSVFIYFPLHVSQKWESHFLQHMKSESHTKQLVTQVCYSFYTVFSQDNSLSIRRSCLPLKSTWLR